MIGSDILFRGYLLIDSDLGRMISEHRSRNAPEIDSEVMVESHPYFIYTRNTLRPDVNSWDSIFDELPLKKPNLVNTLFGWQYNSRCRSVVSTGWKRRSNRRE